MGLVVYFHFFELEGYSLFFFGNDVIFDPVPDLFYLTGLFICEGIFCCRVRGESEFMFIGSFPLCCSSRVVLVASDSAIVGHRLF